MLIMFSGTSQVEALPLIFKTCEDFFLPQFLTTLHKHKSNCTSMCTVQGVKPCTSQQVFLILWKICLLSRSQTGGFKGAPAWSQSISPHDTHWNETLPTPKWDHCWHRACRHRVQHPKDNRDWQISSPYQERIFSGWLFGNDSVTETSPREIRSYTNKFTNKNNLYELPTYTQKLFLRDLVTCDSFILQPGKDPGNFFNHVTSPHCPRAGAPFRNTRGEAKSSATMMLQHRDISWYFIWEQKSLPPAPLMQSETPQIL